MASKGEKIQPKNRGKIMFFDLFKFVSNEIYGIQNVPMCVLDLKTPSEVARNNFKQS